MGSIPLTLCTGLVVCAAGLAPAAALAADGQGVTVIPASPPAGAVVALRASGCSGTTGTAASTAFVTDVHLAGTGGDLTGQAEVRSTAGAGDYTVQVTCGGSAVTGSVTVVRQSQPDAPGVVPASPFAPVHAGGGGTAPLASVDARSAGPDAAQAVTGLLLAAVAAVAVGLLSARRRHGSH
ncbi:MAG: hypothetical protein JF597_46575 [Streptomyces sp.]|uniref:hypothetical protein n=1 Tax=Streptomyces sp. TaxID=1931 RepID=UPI0025CEDCF2|nr:hypothetical protein [Streptomyces sp.]MBW8800770.1 hypothetical protein [Streptomyces sp.]